MEGLSYKSFFRILNDPSPVVELVFDVLLRIKIPKKVRFFLASFLGCINTMGKVLRKLSLLKSPFRCILCQKAEENLDHLLRECPFAKSV